MFQLQLLRRPLSPKMEPEQYIPKRKFNKGVREKEKESRKILGDVNSKPPLPEKSQPVSLCFPDQDFGVQIPSLLNRNFVIPAYLSGPPCFPIQNRYTPARLWLPTLKVYPFYLPEDFIVRGVNMIATSLRSVIPKYVPKKPFISHYNYEVYSSLLIAKEMKSPEKVATIFLQLNKSDTTLIREEQSKKSMLDKIQIMLDEKQIMLDEEQRMNKKSTAYEKVKQETNLAESVVFGVGCKTELSPIDMDSELLKKAEMEVLFCIMHRKTGLSFKAHFLSQLPDLSHLSNFLLYLNLSFNNFDCFPPELFHLKCLEVLNLRNNPTNVIPEQISELKNLKFLTISFNLLTTLPFELFTLPNLQSLDVSYNELEYIPNEIQNLRNLTYLNVEGNLLYFLPCGILKLELSQLLVENNFLNTCFWNETSQVQPQRLTDMAALCFVKHQLWKIYHQIPEEVQDIISNFAGCDCCMGPLYGKGFRFILIYKNVYGLKLPYQFSACSPACYMAFVKSVGLT